MSDALLRDGETGEEGAPQLAERPSWRVVVAVVGASSCCETCCSSLRSR